ncbi:hypothetical protein HDU93_006431, partial [Gonapodya sp. JEL0774]
MDELPTELVAKIASLVSVSDVVALASSGRSIRSKIEASLSEVFTALAISDFDLYPIPPSNQNATDSSVSGSEKTGQHPWRMISAPFRKLHDRYLLRQALLVDDTSLTISQLVTLSEMLADSRNYQNVMFLLRPVRQKHGERWITKALLPENILANVWRTCIGEHMYPLVARDLPSRGNHVRRDAGERSRDALGAAFGLLVLFNTA